MHKFTASVASAFGLLSLASAQAASLVPVPAVSGAGSGSGSGCDACYIVADVAGIAFGTETLTATQTNQAIVTPSLNGTVTTTSVIFDFGSFTVASGAAVPATGAASGAYNTDGSTLVVNGVTLTSPTAYNVFTAYQVTQVVYSNGACLAVYGGATTLPTAFSVPIPSSVNNANYASFQAQAESSFVAYIGSQTCSPAGENIATTTHTPVVVSTVNTTVTATSSARPPTVTAASTSAPAAATESFLPLISATQSTFLPGGTGTITLAGNNSYAGVPSVSIQSAGGSRSTMFGSWFAGLVAFVAGVVA